MTRVLDRMRSGRIGLFGVILLILLVLVVAHALVMGVSHDDSEACGSCVVVLLTGLAVMASTRTAGPLRPPGVMLDRWSHCARVRHRPFRPPPLRSVVLRV